MCRHIIRQVIDINRDKKWTENGSLWLWGTPRFRKDIDARHTFQGLKSSLGTSQGLQPQKFQSGSSCGTFESTEQKKKLWYEIKCCFLKKNLAKPTKQDLHTLLGVLFKISDKQPCPFDMGIPPGLAVLQQRQVWCNMRVVQ